jgi:hypothetical protein
MDVSMEMIRKHILMFNATGPPHFWLRGLRYGKVDIAIFLQGSAGRKDFWLNAFNNTNFNASVMHFWDHWTKPWTVENRNGEWPELGER